MSRTLRTVFLWILAFVLMATAAVFQRLTGPTHPQRGYFQAAGQRWTYRLLRSHETTQGAPIAIPDPGNGATATLLCRRHPTSEPWTRIPMHPAEQRGRRVLEARLPVQPAAGKMAYQIALEGAEGVHVLPEQGPVVLRYKDPVPLPLLLCHIACMFFGMLLGVRTGLSALFEPERLRAHTLATLLLLTAGGLVLGPFVQKHAFGAYWTGWPLGGDLTDDKTAFLWLAWAIAALIVFLRGRVSFRVIRGAVLLAAAVMLLGYLVPHSARGSQLDYRQGTVRTGK